MLPQLDPQTWQIETERLVLRAPQLGDGTTINAAVCESFVELHRWMPWARVPPTIEESETNTHQGYEAFASGQDYPVRLWLKNGTFVGACGLHRGNRDVPSFELGYWCRTSLTGQGYISEAVQALSVFAFSHFNAQRLEIRCDTRNAGSRRVAEKCDFTLEGILRYFERANDGTLRDTCIFARYSDIKESKVNVPR